MVWYATSEERFGAPGKKGDRGEQIVYEYCLKNNIEWQDCNDYDSQVIKKIDCVIDGIPVDVKANFFKGFLAVETFQNKRSWAAARDGWIFTTQAKQIYTVDVDLEYIYVYNVDDMRRYVARNMHRQKKTKMGDKLIWVPATTDFVRKIQ